MDTYLPGGFRLSPRKAAGLDRVCRLNGSVALEITVPPERSRGVAYPRPLTLPAARRGSHPSLPEPACPIRRPTALKRAFGLILLAAAMTAGCAPFTMTAAVVTKTGTGASARPASPSAPAPSSAAGQSARPRAEAAAAALLAEFV